MGSLFAVMLHAVATHFHLYVIGNSLYTACRTVVNNTLNKVAFIFIQMLAMVFRVVDWCSSKAYAEQDKLFAVLIDYNAFWEVPVRHFSVGTKPILMADYDSIVRAFGLIGDESGFPVLVVGQRYDDHTTIHIHNATMPSAVRIPMNISETVPVTPHPLGPNTILSATVCDKSVSDELRAYARSRPSFPRGVKVCDVYGLCIYAFRRDPELRRKVRDSKLQWFNGQGKRCIVDFNEKLDSADNLIDELVQNSLVPVVASPTVPSPMDFHVVPHDEETIE